MKKGIPYFKVLTLKGDESADVMLYGYIGQDIWWEDDEDKNESLTDLEVVRKLKDLELMYNRINIRINSPGGSIFHGDPIINAIRTSTAEIHTYVDGLAASMAADIWLAGKYRHMATNGKLMIHCSSSVEWGTAKDMRECADMLDKFDAAAIAVMAESTGMSEEEVKNQFYDYKDHWFTRNDVKAMGLLSDDEPYEAPDEIEDPEKMTLPELIRHFNHTGDMENKGILERVLSRFNGIFKSNSINKSQPEMNKTELARSLDANELTVDEVQEVLAQKGLSVLPVADVQKQAKEQQEFATTVNELQTSIEKMQEEIARLTTKAAEVETRIAAGSDTNDDDAGTLDANLKRYAELAEDYRNPFSGL